ncbi:DUF2884 family protein [Dyella humicola]|uniref:DUF2884 family protein n=1 Tax=Dyella humicola TaxID=2992126 RepID=UPI002254273A|nr:DUF2884 family protein [Dyella humicola]
MIFRRLPLLLAIAGMITACSNSSNDTQVFGGHTDIINHRITLQDGQVTIHAEGAPDAVVDGSGKLTIDGHDVPVNDAQRALLQHYNASAQAMREDAIATGKAGAATAAKAVGSVASKLAGSDEDKAAAHDEIEAAAKNVKVAAGKICDDVASMKAAQDELATQLDAFKPYATALGEANVEKCREHSSN